MHPPGGCKKKYPRVKNRSWKIEIIAFKALLIPCLITAVIKPITDFMAACIITGRGCNISILFSLLVKTSHRLMTRTTFLLLLYCNMVTVQAWSQKPAADSLPQMATVNVSVTSMKGQARKGEVIIFRGEKTGRMINGISDAAGKIKQLLPPGDTYNVSVKSISDTTRYAILTVPTLEKDEYFSEDFWVKIKFDPAKSYRLDNVHFDTDKASLRPDSYTELSELLDYLQRHEEIKVEIAGHTDNVGTDAHNLKLSQDRAGAIVRYLTGKGIKVNRLTAKGYGATQPAADNAAEEGRQMNRRTEVRIL
jgi:outer membrane protein OmpA-like peptidoglycan-associated protein